MDKWNLFLSANVLFDVLTILTDHFNTISIHFVWLFSILSQKEKFYVKRKSNAQSSCMIFFKFYIRWTDFLRGILSMKSGITMNMSNT